MHCSWLRHGCRPGIGFAGGNSICCGGTGDVKLGVLTVGVKGMDGRKVGMLGPCCAGGLRGSSLLGVREDASSEVQGFLDLIDTPIAGSAGLRVEELRELDGKSGSRGCEDGE